METLKPSFDVIENTWERRLRERGLVPSRIGSGIATGHDRLELYRHEAQVAEYTVDRPPGHGFLASLEVRATLSVPSLGVFMVSDLITRRGPSMEGALQACAETFMDVTFPPLEALFTGERPEGLGTGTVTLTSFSIELDRAIKWNVILGPLQVLSDPDGLVRERLKVRPPFTLVLDALTGHLSRPELHWCKLFGANTAAAGVAFGCAVDGHKSEQGEAEMSGKFGEPPAGDWEFRQFVVVHPAGDADPATTADLRARAAEAFPRRKSWWSRLTGRAD